MLHQKPWTVLQVATSANEWRHVNFSGQHTYTAFVASEDYHAVGHQNGTVDVIERCSDYLPFVASRAEDPKLNKLSRKNFVGMTSNVKKVDLGQIRCSGSIK